MKGLFFIIVGAIYLIKPNIFRRGMWLKTSVAVQTMKPKSYEIYMRILGGAFIITGIVFILVDKKII